MEKRYLGDGVYAAAEPGFPLVLTSEDGMRVLEVIYFEPQVLDSLMRYIDDLGKEVKDTGTWTPS